MPSRVSPEHGQGLSAPDRAAGTWSRVRDFLLPGAAEDDPGFKREIRRRAVRGIYIIAGVAALMPWVGRLFHLLANYFDPKPMPPPYTPLALLAIAVLSLGIARTSWGRRRARAVAFGLGVGVATVLILVDLHGRTTVAEPAVAAVIDLITVLVVALATIPARPLQMLAFGYGIGFINFVVASVLVRQGTLEEPSMHYYAGFELIVILCGLLAGMNYRLMHETYLAHQNRLAAQTRLLNAETAVSFSRLSATLSHELNSPLGALRSSVGSIRSLAGKQASDEPLDPALADRIRNDAVVGAEASVEKLGEVVGRIQRFTNLDRAEVTRVDLDRMLRDIAQLVSPEGGPNPPVTLKTGSLPPLTLRPQQISSVFSRLIQNAMQAGGAAPVVVEASQSGNKVVVSIRDRGEGLSDSEIAELFEPGFRTRGSRVGASNWGLFTARHVIREHGGEISAERASGGGTIISVRFPVDGSPLSG